MQTLITAILVGLFLLGGCKPSSEPKSDPSPSPTAGGTHAHADGSTHDDHAAEPTAKGDDHPHDEVALGTVMIGDLEIELAQGHGKIVAGKESHLVVKLPYNDKGSTIVRAWLGTEDRTMSRVGKGTYTPSHDDYDIHATSPDPLPDNVQWWIEIQKPDGTKLVGSAKPLMD